MAKVTCMDGIAAISGKLGDLIYRKTPSGNTIAYKAPQRTWRKPTPAELNHPNRFALVCKLVSVLLADPAQRQAYEKAFKKNPSGQKTLRQFVFKQLWNGLPK